MPATSSLYPNAISSGYPTGATWTNNTNAVGSTAATFATFTTATSGAVGAILLQGYAVQTAIGSQPTSIDSVVATVASYEATTARWTSATAQLYSGTTALGTAQTLTLSATTTNTQALTFTGITWANLADLRVLVSATKSGTQSSTFNLDYVGVVVNYTVPVAPTASFTATPLAGSSPLAVQFTDTSTGGATSWSWAFGDSGTSTSQSPSHTYTGAGTYTATLTATNAQGSTQATRTITVLDPNAVGKVPSLVKSIFSTSAASTTTITCTLASAPTAGNLLVFAMGGDKNTGTLTLPAGWTIEYSLLSTSVSQYVAWKVSDGTETSVIASWATASAAGNDAWYAEYAASGFTGTYTQTGKASTITTEATVNSTSTGTTAALTYDSLALAFASIDSSQSITGSETWSSPYSSIRAGTGSAGRASIAVAGATIPSGSTTSSTYTYVGTADQTTASVVAWSLVTGATARAAIRHVGKRSY